MDEIIPPKNYIYIENDNHSLSLCLFNFFYIGVKNSFAIFSFFSFFSTQIDLFF